MIVRVIDDKYIITINNKYIVNDNSSSVPSATSTMFIITTNI